MRRTSPEVDTRLSETVSAVLRSVPAAELTPQPLPASFALRQLSSLVTFGATTVGFRYNSRQNEIAIIDTTGRTRRLEDPNTVWASMACFRASLSPDAQRSVTSSVTVGRRSVQEIDGREVTTLLTVERRQAPARSETTVKLALGRTMVSESLELGLMEFTQRATLDGGSGLFLAEQPLVVTDEGLKVAGAVDAADLAHLDIQPPLDAALSPRQWNSLLIDTLPRMSAA